MTGMEVSFEPLTKKTIPSYIEVGTQSYKEHYLHLWKGQDPKPYLDISFTKEVAQLELDDPNCLNYLVKCQNVNAGILKIEIDHKCADWSANDALYLHRIYLLKSATGQNIGKKVLAFTDNLARNFNKKVIWLETMKKGKAKNFYQNHGYQTIGESNVQLLGILEEEKAMWVMVKHL